MFILYGSL